MQGENKKVTVKELIAHAVDDTKVSISLPSEIGIELVQANGLRQYELSTWLIGLFATIASGFWTAFAIGPMFSGPLLWSAAIFTIVALIYLLIVRGQRKEMFRSNVTKSRFLKDFDGK